jgi:antirestriction protein ArdC
MANSTEIIAGKVTDKIIELMEQGTCVWRRPWSQQNHVPCNFDSKQSYKGLNALMCATHPWWLTFNQVKAKGGSVKAGSKGTTIFFTDYITLDKDGKKTDKKDEIKSRIPFLRNYVVFNNDQIAGIEFPKQDVKVLSESEKIESGEKIVSDLQANADLILVSNDKSRAFYSPSGHYVNMPPFEAFGTSTGYYGVIFHEIAHWTGLELGRFTKETAGGFGSETYSFEELVAELTTAIVCSSLQIDLPLENSAAYIASWAKVLKNDKNMIIKASKAATKSANLIFQKAATKKEVETV